MLLSRKHYTILSLKQESKCFTKMLFKREQIIFWLLLFQASLPIRSSHQLSTSISMSIQSKNQESKIVNNTNQHTSASDKLQQEQHQHQHQQQQQLQQHAAVDDLLKDTFMLLDVLDQKLASVNNKTPNALMRDNLRALDGATENEYNSESGATLHERSLNDRQADFARLDEALFEESVENLADDQVVSGQRKSNKDDSISVTQSSNVDMQNVQPLNLVKYHQSETSSLTSQDGSLVSPPSTSTLKEEAKINLSSSNENKASKRSKQLAGGAPFGGGSLASFVDNDNQLASDSTERHIKFTLDLMQSIFSSQSYSSKTNLIESFLISPLSIQMVLMMMHLGARGQTRREISNCLHLTQATTSEKLLAAAIQQQHPIDLGSSSSNVEVISSTSPGNNSKLKRRHHYLQQQQQQQQQQATTESVKQQNANGKLQQQQANLRQQTSSSSQQQQQQQQQQNGNGNPHELFGAAMRNLLKDPIIMKALTSANQIFLQKTLPLSPQYDWAIKHYYSADVKLVDFQHQSTSTSPTTTTSSPSSSTATTSTVTAAATQPTSVSSSSTTSPNSISPSSLFTFTSPTTPNLPNVGLTNPASQTQHVILEKGKAQSNTDYQPSSTTNVTTNATYHNEHSHHHHQQQYNNNNNNNNRNNFHLNQQRTRSANPNSVLSSEQEQANNVQQMVNDWVEKQTKGRISNFLSSPISTSTLMMAINVLYFKGDWQYKFDPSDTESDAWFTQANGKMTKIPMMVNRLPLAFAHDPQMKTSVIELPYKAQRLGLFLLLPDEVSGIFHTMQMLNSTSFANLISSMRKLSPSADQGSNGINVRIPKFSIESSPRLSQILSQQLGLKTLFTPDIADLSGMFAHMQSNYKRSNNSSTTSSEHSNSNSNQQLPLQVGLDELLHKAVLQVDEQGSVAAASSATIVERVGVFNNNYFEADHPFLLFLMDKQTGLVLFSGAFAGNNNNGDGNTNHQETQQQRQHHKI